ncbi:hypothetical protein [Mycolicibacterium mengxianglii]|nr:hypothetical protein [Mycolicibacterium mengxianglii]
MRDISGVKHAALVFGAPVVVGRPGRQFRAVPSNFAVPWTRSALG